MLVETFECEETKDETPEMSEAAIAIIESMGLSGQARLVGRTSDGLGDEMNKPARCPYRKMTAEEAFVYGTLCPAKTKLRDFGEGPIPLRVLQVAAHANGLGMFDELVVWHVAGPAVKDPVLVGMKKHPTNTWTHEPFILARWGDVLDEYPAMLKAAMARWRENMKATLAEIRGEVTRDEGTIDTVSLEQMVGAAAPSYSGFGQRAAWWR